MINILLFSFFLFLFAFLILILKPNLLFILFSFEVMLLAINVNFIFGGILLNDVAGWIFALILFSVAAIDTGLGLLLILNYLNIRFSSKRTYLKKS